MKLSLAIPINDLVPTVRNDSRMQDPEQKPYSKTIDRQQVAIVQNEKDKNTNVKHTHENIRY